jgi:hypothetical protein
LPRDMGPARTPARRFKDSTPRPRSGLRLRTPAPVRENRAAWGPILPLDYVSLTPANRLKLTPVATSLKLDVWGMRIKALDFAVSSCSGSDKETTWTTQRNGTQ